MELRQLQYFVAVVEEASFTRAAERVLVAQSGVSAQVRRLEAELGIALLDRGARTVTPTEAGAAVLPFARAALAAVKNVREAADALRGLTRGHVRVGMVTAGPSETLTELLASFHALHPGVEITLVEDASDALFAALRSGELDLACASLGPAAPEGIETQVIIDAAVVAAVAPGHPLASRNSIELHELTAYPLICLPRGTGVRALWDATGVRARVAFEASDPSVLAQLAARGLGVAILPEP
ncbi:MAG TPA: LysR family transcriptional regulator, partial [Solirubrobacter sp.]